MESLHELYRIGCGPSSSHALGPQAAAVEFRQRHPTATSMEVTLLGSLAATGKGHGTDRVLKQAFSGLAVRLLWHPEEVHPFHPNGLLLRAFDADLVELGQWQVFSVGGGALRTPGQPPPPQVYAQRSMAEVLSWCADHAAPWAQLVRVSEGPGFEDFLADIWRAMRACVERGLQGAGELPGGLGLQRKAASFAARARVDQRRGTWLSAFALATMEENAVGGEVVTAPTCGACGVLPAVLCWLQDSYHLPDSTIYEALATAGLVGNLVKQNGSISGAEVGCQGEVGTACAMAAAAACAVLGGTPGQCEYAAEMALEHHLGLTCDPILGLVQAPCIERNAFAATRAVDCADYALAGDGGHRISFDEVVEALVQTGRDLGTPYRETATGGLARVHRLPTPGTGDWRRGS
jgi:L-serine dehydratase